jgi:hypothetical protein
MVLANIMKSLSKTISFITTSCVFFMGIGSSYSAELNQTGFIDKEDFFNWNFNWDGKGGLNAELVPDRTQTQQEEGIAWKLFATLTTDQSNSPFALILKGQHIVPVPSHLTDAPEGDLFEKVVRINSLNLATQNKFIQAFTQPVDHLHNPKKHYDIYQLNYKVLDDGNVNFQFTGVHSNVPEPLTVLGSLTALGFGTVLKKRYSKKLQKSTV